MPRNRYVIIVLLFNFNAPKQTPHTFYKLNYVTDADYPLVRDTKNRFHYLIDFCNIVLWEMHTYIFRTDARGNLTRISHKPIQSRKRFIENWIVYLLYLGRLFENSNPSDHSIKVVSVSPSLFQMKDVHYWTKGFLNFAKGRIK